MAMDENTRDEYIDYLLGERKKMHNALASVRQLFVEEQLTIGAGFAGVFAEVCNALDGYTEPLEPPRAPLPTVEQAAWVIGKLTDHFMQGGTFGYLVHNRMGYNGKGDYEKLQVAGGLYLSNVAFEYSEDHPFNRVPPAPPPADSVRG
jgi:hypothetical protein